MVQALLLQAHCPRHAPHAPDRPSARRSGAGTCGRARRRTCGSFYGPHLLGRGLACRIMRAHEDPRQRPRRHPAQLSPGRRRLRVDRPAEGGRAACRGGHGAAPAGAWLQRSARLARRVGLCGGCRPLLPGQHRRMPGLEGAGGRRDVASHRPQLLRRDRAGHHRHGHQRPDHGRRHAAGGAGLLGGGRLRLVCRRGTCAGPGGGLEACLRPLRRVMGRRRDARAGRHRRTRPHRPGGLVHRAGQPEGAAVAGREARPRRCHRAAGLERHPCQRPEPGAQAGRAAAAGLPDAGAARPELMAMRCWRRRCCIRR